MSGGLEPTGGDGEFGDVAGAVRDLLERIDVEVGGIGEPLVLLIEEDLHVAGDRHHVVSDVVAEQPVDELELFGPLLQLSSDGVIVRAVVADQQEHNGAAKRGSVRDVEDVHDALLSTDEGKPDRDRRHDRSENDPRRDAQHVGVLSAREPPLDVAE